MLGHPGVGSLLLRQGGTLSHCAAGSTSPQWPREVHLLSAKLCRAGVDWKAVAEYVDISKDLEIFLPESDAIG